MQELKKPQNGIYTPHRQKIGTKDAQFQQASWKLKAAKSEVRTELANSDAMPLGTNCKGMITQWMIIDFLITFDYCSNKMSAV